MINCECLMDNQVVGHGIRLQRQLQQLHVVQLMFQHNYQFNHHRASQISPPAISPPIWMEANWYVTIHINEVSFLFHISFFLYISSFFLFNIMVIDASMQCLHAITNDMIIIMLIAHHRHRWRWIFLCWVLSAWWLTADGISHTYYYQLISNWKDTSYFCCWLNANVMKCFAQYVVASDPKTFENEDLEKYTKKWTQFPFSLI